ncbi:hypothetical protein [Microcoleus vaginatus]|uniref:hypothetical protein n=1 Tax=Microcoleus vaginatus TaxID=119532 RepID=UPI00403F342C
MTVATRQSNAQILEVKLQQHLQAAGFKKLPLYISCDFRDESLTVVGEHPRSLVLKAKPTFAVLEAAILEIEPESIQQIGLCLKITGQKQPYAFHSFTMHQPVLSRPKTVQLFKKTENTPAEETGIVLTENVVPTADVEEEIPLETDGKDAWEEEYFPHLSESSSNSDPIAFKVAAIPVDIADNPFNPLDMEAVTVAQKPKHSPFAMLAAAGMVSMAALILAGGYYMLSRPCVIGECSALANAKQLSENSTKTLKTSKVANSPQEAQRQLKQAIALLEPIPSWSIHRGEAQSALESYRKQNQNLNSAIDAARLAQSAAQKTQNPPYSAEGRPGSASSVAKCDRRTRRNPPRQPSLSICSEKVKRIPEKFSNWKSAVKHRETSRKNPARRQKYSPNSRSSRSSSSHSRDLGSSAIRLGRIPRHPISNSHEHDILPTS